MLSDALETGTVQINSAPARGPDHFPFQGIKDSGIGSQVRPPTGCTKRSLLRGVGTESDEERGFGLHTLLP